MAGRHGISGALAIKGTRMRANSRPTVVLPRQKKRRSSTSSTRSLPLDSRLEGDPRGNFWRNAFPMRYSLPEKSDRWPVPSKGNCSPVALRELPNGKDAWNKDVKRPSKRKLQNKVGDSSYPHGDASHIKYKQSGAVNIVLYVGFIMIGLGMILTFIGMGERGFKTKELTLIGPSLIGAGILFALLRILFCSCSCKKKSKPLDEKSLLSPSNETLTSEPRTINPSIAPFSEDISVDAGREMVATRSEKRPKTNQSTIPNYIEDEAESDIDLALVMQKSPLFASRPGTSKSLSSQKSQIPKLPEIANSSEEVLLDPLKLASR